MLYNIIAEWLFDYVKISQFDIIVTYKNKIKKTHYYIIILKLQ